MTAFSALRAGAAAFALIGCATSAHAQYMPAPTPNADALATQMKILGGDPRNVYALIAAGELSTKLGDPAAALGFFGRAQAIDPGNMRIAAGRASALVLLERPGEALRLFDQAERAGVAMDPYLQQRGLAYDLIGQPGHAQRDYRRSLRIAPDDETIRRLALSLGISGRRDEAMSLLDPLLRRSDRAAWRARACIIAIGGDPGGAQKIATSMIPGGAGLSPFFSRLQWLSPADRAFAVHFGEVTANAARLNDARLAPALATLPAESTPLPSVTVAATVVDRPSRETSLDRRARAGRVAIDTAAVMPRPAPPDAGAALAVREVRPSPIEPFAPPPAPRMSEPMATAMASDIITASPPVQQLASAPAPVILTPAPTPAASPPPGPSQWAMTADSPPAAPIDAAAVTTPPPSRVETIVIDAPRPSAAETAAAAAPPPSAPAPAAVAPTPPVRTPTMARRNTELLASIVSSITVPASELDIAPMRPARAAAVAKPDTKKLETKKPEPKKPEPKKPEPRKPDPAKGEPARWWAQVARGANAADLGKDWKRLAVKSPAAFRGTSAWTAQARATNRLLAGPFTSQDKATAFVNALAKDGSSAFAWQSEAGQVISRLAPR